MKIKIILFLFSMAFIYYAIGQDETRKPIKTGFVFIDGKYIDAPYKIKIKKDIIYINNNPIWLQNPNQNNGEMPKIKDDPGMPPDSINTLNKFWGYKNSKNVSFFSSKAIYYYSHYKPEIAENKIKEFFSSLPFIKSTYEDPKLGFTIVTERNKVYQPDWTFYKNFYNKKDYKKEFLKNSSSKEFAKRRIITIKSILQNGAVYIAYTNGETAISLNYLNAEKELQNFIETYNDSSLSLDEKINKCKNSELYKQLSLPKIKELLINPLDNNFKIRINKDK